jgi:divinyl protochlorophyllide a 8-vinyl-reductase
MVKAPPGYLRKPAGPGQVAPELARDLIAAAEATLGTAASAALLAAARLAAVPPLSESLPEDTARALHHALRRSHPAEAPAILAAAGRSTADSLIASRLSPRAQTMLSAGPWTISGWLLGRWAAQNGWTFAGSGRLSQTGPLSFEIRANPLIRGETAPAPLCHFHAALFEQLFRRLVDPRLACREMACAATGAPACVFVLALDA